ncbi:MAG: methyltransferase domain-containing protein, partial [Deltaproteobacteria bacterium]|nr:methyltransferase domain-containing protein [Deltaproteobacteria bacterium]
MSKDGKDMAPDGQKRRRRKGGGLRVPSDNVPRKPQTPEISAQSAEDPQLAVSVAYAFSDDEKGERQRLDATIPDDPDLEPGDAPAGAGESVDIDVDDFEAEVEHDDEQTTITDMAAVEMEAEAEADAEPPSFGMAAVAAPLPTPSDDEPPEEGSKEAVSADADPAEQPPKPSLPPPSKASLPEPKGVQPSAALPAPPPAAVPAPPETQERGEAQAEGKATKKKWPRIQTQALSDADLDSMVIGEGGRQPADDLPEAVAKLEDEGAINAPGDPGESGEILSEELLEEVSEVPAATGNTMEISVAEIEELPAGSEAQGAPAAVPTKPAAEAKPKTPPPAPKGSAPAGPAPKAARRKSKPWFEEIFDEDYLRTLPFLTPQTTQAEATFVIDSLAAEPGAQILDVGCGYGRHAMELAARGYHVVGLDSSLPLLLRGADEAQRRGLNINFVHGDMRE